MKSPCQLQSQPQRRLSVAWQDSIWFPPVLAKPRLGARQRRPVLWPVQIITDPTVCVGRTVSL